MAQRGAEQQCGTYSQNMIKNKKQHSQTFELRFKFLFIFEQDPFKSAGDER